MEESSILPQGSVLTNNFLIDNNTLGPTKTYKVDFEKGSIVGFCDEVEALKQAIYLILNTERYEYLIYSWNYGVEFKGVIGKNKAIEESEYKRVIKEALVQDDRIEDVDNFTFNYEKDSALIRFTVFSIYGEIQFERVVR